VIRNYGEPFWDWLKKRLDEAKKKFEEEYEKYKKELEEKKKDPKVPEPRKGLKAL